MVTQITHAIDRTQAIIDYHNLELDKLLASSGPRLNGWLLYHGNAVIAWTRHLNDLRGLLK